MNNTVLFSLLNDEVVVTDLASGHPIWAGFPLGRKVIDLAHLRDEARAVVLLESYGSRADDRPNLVAIEADGELIWRAPLPTPSPSDAYTSMEVVESGVSAFSWSGHFVLLSEQTGEIVRDEFTK